MTFLSALLPPLALGAVALWFGIRGRIRLFVYYVPASLCVIAVLIWGGLGVPPWATQAFIALLAMGLFLSASFGMGWIVHRVMESRDD